MKTCRIFVPTPDKAGFLLVDDKEQDYQFIVDGMEIHPDQDTFTFAFFDNTKEPDSPERMYGVTVSRKAGCKVTRIYRKDLPDSEYLDIPLDHPFAKHIYIVNSVPREMVFGKKPISF